MWACLFNIIGRICETAIYDSRLIRYQHFVLIAVMAEYPASHKYGVAKWITIRNAFSAKVGFVIRRNPNICQISDKVNFLFRESLQANLIQPHLFQCDYSGICCSLNQQVFVEMLFFHCCERGLFRMVCYEWPVMNRTVLNGQNPKQWSANN